MTKSELNLRQRIKNLENAFAKSRVSIEDLRNKLDASHRFMIQNVNFISDIETRYETVKALCIDRDLFTADEFESKSDQIRGLRVKEAEEVIEKGDILRVTYEGREKGTEKILMSGNQFPMRIGSNSLILEEYLLGRRVDEKNIKFDFEFPADYKPEPSIAGKKLEFNVSVDRVKTPLENRNNGN